MSLLFGRGPYQPVINVIGGIRVNTSLQGTPTPLVYGRNRIAPNLIWYNDFFWVQVSGGKKGNTGGGGTGKKAGGEYDYGAAVILALCQGPINGVGTVWNTAGNLPSQVAVETFTVPGGGGSYTATNQSTYLHDLGVNRGDGYSVVVNDYGAPGPITLTGTQQTPMTFVQGSGTPGTGQYTRTGTNNATYHFAAGDAGKTMTIAYVYAPPLNTGGLPQDPIATVGFTLFNGTQEQAPWSYLSSKHPSQAIGYSTLAYLATPVLDLGFSAVLPNFNFEIFGLLPFGATGGSSGASVSDHFTIAGSSLPSTWTVNFGTWKVFNQPAFPPFTLVAGAQAFGGATPSHASAYWNANPFGPDQSATCNLGFGGSVHIFDTPTGWTGPAVRVSASAETYYAFMAGHFQSLNASNVPTWRLDKLVAGVRTNLATGAIPVTPPNQPVIIGQNDGYSLSVQGSILVARINGTIVATVTDSSITTGQPGMAAYLPDPPEFGNSCITSWSATQTPYGANPSTGPSGDSNPSDVLQDIFTNALYGCGIQTGELGDFTPYSSYCVANGLFVSPVLDSQRTAADWIRDILDATNSEIVESGGVLKVIPYGDSSIVGNGVQFTPATNPIYNLTADSFIRSGTTPPIEITRPSVQDAYNSVRIEYSDRGNSYNPSIVEAQDLVSLQSYKYRPEPIRQYHMFTTQPPAALSAQLALSRNVYIRNKYKFTLPQLFILLDPMDLVTVPAQLLGMAASLPAVPVRITSISEQDDRTLEVEAEQFPWGTAGNTLYPKQALTPGGPQVMAPPGSVNVPIIFEALSRMNNQIGHSIWFGLSGANANWGGARIWISMDGTNYKQIATAVGQTQMGGLTANLASHADPDSVDTLAVDLTESFGALISYTAAETNAFASLCYVGPNPTPVPASPTLSSVPASPPDVGTKYVKITYVTPIGETSASPEASFLVGPSSILHVASPASSPQVTGWNVYVATSSGAETLQNASPLAIGTGWTEPTSGLIGGASPPAASTAELVSYENATLTAAFKYNLATLLRRGVYGSTIGAHPAGSAFAFLNEAVEGYNYDPALIGSTVYFKFTSFNQSGLVEELLANVTAYQYTINGSSVGLLTPSHASYRPTTNPLTAFDAGASATIDIAAFSMRVPGQADIPFGSGAITGLSYNAIYYVYFDDPGFVAIASPTYTASTVKTDALNAANRFYIGSIMTPLQGAANTIGNGDGGAGAQVGQPATAGFTTQTNSTVGNGSVTNPGNAIDGNPSTFATLAVTGNSGVDNAVLTAKLPVPAEWSELNVGVTFSVPTNAAAGDANGAVVYFAVSTDGGSTFGVGYSLYEPGSPHTPNGTQTLQTVYIPVAPGTSMSELQVQVAAQTDSSQTSGAVSLQVNEIFLSGVQ